jgi:hypothetical protein
VNPEAKMEAIKLLNRSYYDLQKLRIEQTNRVSRLVRDRLLTETEADDHYGVTTEFLEQAEKTMRRQFAQFVRDLPIWREWLLHIRGIAETLAAGLIAEIGCQHQAFAVCSDGTEKWHTRPPAALREELVAMSQPGAAGQDTAILTGPALKAASAELKEWLTRGNLAGVHPTASRHGIACFDTVSRLWSYCGMGIHEGEVQRLQRGVRANWNTWARTLCWKIADCQIKCNGPYRPFYDRYKERDRQAHPVKVKTDGRGRDGKIIYRFSDGHMHARALRFIAKLFLSHLWQKWRVLGELPIRAPYPVEYQGHTQWIGPDEMIRRPAAEAAA